MSEEKRGRERGLEERWKEGERRLYKEDNEREVEERIQKGIGSVGERVVDKGIKKKKR